MVAALQTTSTSKTLTLYRKATMEQIAENYQLKWHSFGTYLHSCIATSLQNESFADVALVTVDGRQIMAHRFVLSACSQYLHQILKLQPRITTALPLMIILPPEINYRTMKTLIQYMYSGEATVSKDILEPVLRGGDILKVKGLWRPKEDEPHDNRIVKVSHNQQQKDKSNKTKTPVDQKDPESPNPTAAAPKVLNYTINVMKTYESKNDNNANKDKSSVINNKQPSEGDKKVKPKPNNQQNSVIKSTEEEKRTQEKEIKTSDSSDESEKPDQNSDTLQFLVIKEEPIEWSEVNEAEMELVDEKEVFSTEMTIKPEIYMEDSEEQVLYSPLTCELCTETFTLPAEWVRHVQTHTDMLPAKRQRRGKPQDDDGDAPYPQLHCDLCQKYFPTPAEWVHHIQNTHTEFELHLSNKTAPGKVIKTPRSFGPAQNSCTICSKKFPSHASLLIHKRTHTGEKPYMCELCYKGFNVKSNLLRHLRTVHDKIINPTEVDDNVKDDSPGD